MTMTNAQRWDRERLMLRAERAETLIGAASDLLAGDSKLSDNAARLAAWQVLGRIREFNAQGKVELP